MATADVLTDRQLQPDVSQAHEYDSTVRADIELCREHTHQFTAEQLTAYEFRPFRLRRGIYSQRQDAVHMIRTKIPGGLLAAEQMVHLAMVAERYGGDKGHLTTRQNMQYHF